MNFETFKKAFSEKKIAPVYHFLGEEDYLQKRCFTLVRNLIAEQDRDFAFKVFDMQDGAKIKTALEHCRTRSLMSEQQVVVCRNFTTCDDAELALVTSYLKNPASHTVLCFQNTTLDKRRKLSKLLIDKTMLVELPFLDEGSVSRWIVQYAKMAKVVIEPAAVNTLIMRAGISLTRLMNELNKLIAVAGEKPISVKMVEYMVIRTREQNSFDLWTALLDGDRKGAIKLLDQLLGQKEEPVMLVGLLASFYRKLYLVKQGFARKTPTKTIMSEQRLFGDQGKKFMVLSNQISEDRIKKNIQVLAETDLGIKSGQATPRLQIQFALLQLLCD